VRRIVIGVGGASGAPYAERMLSFMKEHAEECGLAPALVFSRMGRLVWSDEVGTDPKEYGFPVYAPGDMTAPFASGSAGYEAMVVVPCSVAGMGRIAHGVSSDLIGRAADVMLKERGNLILVVRESPLSVIHIENMLKVAQAGAMILPASPSFYSHPEDRVALLDTVTARILDQLGIDNELMRRWAGLTRGVENRSVGGEQS
jgi:flavin prenyltransferase